MNGFERDFTETGELQNISTNKKPLFRKSEDTRNEKAIQIPFISEISGYLEHKKLQVQQMETNKKKLKQQITELEEQKNTLVFRITNLKRKESITLTFLDWYESLKQELFDLYHIKLEEEISSFVNLLTDFKYYNYNTHQIVKEYKQIKSLREEMTSIQGNVDSLIKTHDDLLRENRSLEERKRNSKQSLNALIELYHAGFDLKELKQLKNTIIKIAESNGIEYYDAGKKFLGDVENQYDNKLGFETKIKEIETELKKLQDEKPEFEEYLQSKTTISRSLPFLYKFGVTNNDIISMTEVVTAYLNGNITFNPNLQSKNIVDENKLTKVTDYWKMLIHEIKNLGDINHQIIKQHSNLETIKKEIDDLNSQRQKLNEQTLLSGELLNSLYGRLSYFIESIKQIMFSVKNPNKMCIVYQPLFFIHVTTSDDSKDDNNIHTDE